MKKVISLKEFSEQLKGFSNFAIFCHARPDGDAVGSGLALKLGLESLGKKAQVFCADDVPKKYTFIKETSFFNKEFFGEYDCFIATDCAEITRLGIFADLFIKNKNTFNIDHHVSNTRYAKFNYVLDVGANCENVFDLLNQLNVDIDKTVANCLALGIMTDTGNFCHNNVTENTFLIASKLKKLGADFHTINYYSYKLQSKNRAELFAFTMEKIRYYLGGKFALITIDQKDLEKTGAKQEETEGFIDFIMGIEGVLVGACMMEIKPSVYKISFRSNGPDVNEIAGLFGGGGHVLASGCQFNNALKEEVVDKLIYAVKSHIPE